MIKTYLKFLKLLPNNNNFKNHKDNYDFFYKKEFNITNYQIIFGANIVCLITLVFLQILFLNQSIVLKMTSFLIALTLRYYLRNIFRKKIKKKIEIIDSSILMIKNLFELYSSLVQDGDFSNLFIKLMAEWESPLKKDFNKIAYDVQKGYLPENLLKEYKSISETFNLFIKQLMITNFDIFAIDYDNMNKLENYFKEINHSLDTRLSVFFFVLIFFPIGLCFITILQRINGINIVFFLIIYLIILKTLMSNFIINNTELLGIQIYENYKIRKEYLDFLNFYSSLSMNLIYYNPEESFFRSYQEISNDFQKSMKEGIIKLKMFNIPLEEFLNNIYIKIQGKKVKILFCALKDMLLKNSYNTSHQIKKIISILNKHKKIEEEREIILKSEKTRVKIFTFLLPLIIGMIGGILPFMMSLFQEYNSNFFELLPFSIYIMTPLDLTLFIISLFIIIIISGYYFAVLSGQNKTITIISMVLIMSITLLLSNFILNNMRFLFLSQN